MPTGRVVVSTCPARAAVAGNPSDGYGGAVVAIPVPGLSATATLRESDERSIGIDDPDLRRLVLATIDGFVDHTSLHPSVRIDVSTTIPRSVGLAGSSAIVIAVLRGLGEMAGHRWDVVELAGLALSIEADRLGIAAGLQDRLVQSAGHPVSMRFDPVDLRPVTMPVGTHWFVAWSAAAGEDSGIVHDPLRRRFEAGDPVVVSSMDALALAAAAATRAIDDGDAAELGRAMDRSFDLRAAMMPIAPSQRVLIAIGRRYGASVNSAGSGGSVVGMVDDPNRLTDLEVAYAAGGHPWAAIDPVGTG